MLFILMLMNALNLADRQGLAAVAPALKRDLHLSDTELGLIQGLGFAIFYTLLGLPIARLSERSSRARIIAVSIAVFSTLAAAASRAAALWRRVPLPPRAARAGGGGGAVAVRARKGGRIVAAIIIII